MEHIFERYHQGFSKSISFKTPMSYTKDTTFSPLCAGQFEANFTVSRSLFLQESEEKSTHILHITQISPVKRKDVVDSKKRPIRRYPSRRGRDSTVDQDTHTMREGETPNPFTAAHHQRQQHPFSLDSIRHKAM